MEEGRDRTRLGPANDSSTGWFAYSPSDAPGDDVDPVISYVELRHSEYAGPFWTDHGHLSEDYEDLHRWFGISRELYDDAIAWNSEGGSWAQQQDLLRRLRAEVPARIEVPAPRTSRPRVVRLYRLRISDEDGVRSLREEPGPSKEGASLPATSPELIDDVGRWLMQRERFAYGDESHAAAHFAWEDQGSALCRRLGEAWGTDYVVKMLP